MLSVKIESYNKKILEENKNIDIISWITLLNMLQKYLCYKYIFYGWLIRINN